MKRGRYLGLDVGEKTIGIALSDEMSLIVSPVKTLKRQAIKKDMAEIAHLVDEHQVQGIIIGLPLHMDGSTSPMAQAIEKFTNRLRGRVRVPLYSWDERLTSVAAERSLIESGVRREKRKEVIDQAAACLILQTWLDRHRNEFS